MIVLSAVTSHPALWRSLVVLKFIIKNRKAFTHIDTVTCRGLCVTYKTGFGLDIGFIDTLYTQIGTTGNYSAIADLHTLQFTVTHALGFSIFISRILATDLQPSHCKFKSHMKSSLHSLIHFLPLLLNHRRLPSSELDPILAKNFLKRPLYPFITLGMDHAENTASLLLRRLVYWSVA
jgi:hypothetical protein